MTIQDTAGDGVIAFNSLPFVCDRVRFTKCRKGMYVKNTTGRLINCVITSHSVNIPGSGIEWYRCE